MHVHTQGHTYMGIIELPTAVINGISKAKLSILFFNLQIKIHHAQNNFKPCLMSLQSIQIAL